MDFQDISEVLENIEGNITKLVSRHSIANPQNQGVKRGYQSRRYFIYMVIMDTERINPNRINNPNIVGQNVLNFQEHDYIDSINGIVPTLVKIGHTSQKLKDPNDPPNPLLAVKNRITGSFCPYKIRPFFIDSIDNPFIYDLIPSFGQNILDPDKNFRKRIGLNSDDTLQTASSNLSIWEISQTYIDSITRREGTVLPIVKQIEAIIRYNCGEGKFTHGRYARYGGGKEWLRFENKHDIAGMAWYIKSHLQGSTINMDRLQDLTFSGLPDPVVLDPNSDESEESEEYNIGSFADYW